MWRFSKFSGTNQSQFPRCGTQLSLCFTKALRKRSISFSVNSSEPDLMVLRMVKHVLHRTFRLYLLTPRSRGFRFLLPNMRPRAIKTSFYAKLTNDPESQKIKGLYFHWQDWSSKRWLRAQRFTQKDFPQLSNFVEPSASWNMSSSRTS